MSVKISELIIPYAKNYNKITLSLEQYQNIAKKMIKSDLVYINKNILYCLKENSDLFNDIVSAIMVADWSHNPELSTLNYWRKKCCLWTISTIFQHKFSNENKMSKQSNYHELNKLYTEKTPSSEVIEKETSLIIQDAINSLDEKHAKIAELYYYKGYTQKNIAKIYKISQPMAFKIISTIKQQLRNKLEILND